jgi:outer membrane receptor protein involved in Fe transport
VTRLRADGVDVGVRYRLRPLRTGTFTFNGQLEIVERYEEQFLRATPAVDKVDVVADSSSGGLMESAVVSPRARASLAWQRGAWSAALGMSYTPQYRTETTTPTATLPGATGLDGDFIGSSTRWDLQVGYSVGPKREGSWRDWLADTTWTLGVRNLLDTEPPYRSDGTSFYSRFDDPRMRFLYLRAQWRR